MKIMMGGGEGAGPDGRFFILRCRETAMKIRALKRV